MSALNYIAMALWYQMGPLYQLLTTLSITKPGRYSLSMLHTCYMSFLSVK
jgi:hypothetical protein